MSDIVLSGAASPIPSSSSDAAALDFVCAKERLEHSIAATLCVIAAARTERETAPISAARRQLVKIYGATRLRRRLEREASAA